MNRKFTLNDKKDENSECSFGCRFTTGDAGDGTGVETVALAGIETL